MLDIISASFTSSSVASAGAKKVKSPVLPPLNMLNASFVLNVRPVAASLVTVVTPSAVTEFSSVIRSSLKFSVAVAIAAAISAAAYSYSSSSVTITTSGAAAVTASTQPSTMNEWY